MGLDGVEIVMEVEDHFGITIQDAEAEQVRTVADVVTIVASRIKNARESTCPTLSSFMRIRKCVRNLTSDNDLRIRTQTRVVDVMDSAQRKRFWQLLEEIIGSPPPALRRAPLLRNILLCTVSFAFILAVLLAFCTELSNLPFYVAIASAFTLVLHWVSVRFRSHPPESLSTFGLIACKVAGLTVATKRLELRSDAEILAELKPLISGIIDVPEHKILPSSRFMEDLGVG